MTLGVALAPRTTLSDGEIVLESVFGVLEGVLAVFFPGVVIFVVAGNFGGVVCISPSTPKLAPNVFRAETGWTGAGIALFLPCPILFFPCSSPDLGEQVGVEFVILPDLSLFRSGITGELETVLSKLKDLKCAFSIRRSCCSGRHFFLEGAVKWCVLLVEAASRSFSDLYLYWAGRAASPEQPYLEAHGVNEVGHVTRCALRLFGVNEIPTYGRFHLREVVYTPNHLTHTEIVQNFSSIRSLS